MLRFITALMALLIILPVSCKKGSNTGKDLAVGKKYAKYKVAVNKDKELKTWLATLEKAEDVSLIEEEKIADKSGKAIEISKVKLADDSVGFIESRHLADIPIVFITDTRAFERPTSGSSVYAVIPKGELGFIIGEKGLWVQVYVGELNKKHITKHWVESGYSKEQKLVLEAKEYAAAVAGLNDKDQDKVKQAKSMLETLAGGTSAISELAKKKIDPDKAGKSEEPVKDERPSQPQQENINTKPQQ